MIDPVLQIGDRRFDLSRPAVMGIVNASPESFSGDARGSVDEQVRQVGEQFAAGALVVDLGGQSANTKTPELAVDVETERLVPLVEGIRRAGIDGLLSVDTYKPAVADACLRAGADIVNDVSALHDPDLADVVAEHRAGFVLMHTVGPPKVKILDPGLYGDVVDDVLQWGAQTLEHLAERSVPPERVLFDPGIDFAKTPRQSLDLLHGLDRFAALARPLLLALSRKDFIGAVTGTAPRERDPGTLASVGAVAARFPASVVRVHDVAGTVQYLRVAAAIDDPDLLEAGAELAEGLRREPSPGD